MMQVFFMGSVFVCYLSILLAAVNFSSDSQLLPVTMLICECLFALGAVDVAFTLLDALPPTIGSPDEKLLKTWDLGAKLLVILENKTLRIFCWNKIYFHFPHKESKYIPKFFIATNELNNYSPFNFLIGLMSSHVNVNSYG